LQVHDEFGYDSFNFSLYMDCKNSKEIVSSRSKTIGSLGLGHGGTVYLKKTDSSTTPTAAEPGPSSRRERQDSVGTVNVVAHGKAKVVEMDLIDIQLWSEDGKIQRGRDSKL
jgi:hypothetical protein